ncbi:MAG: hypothetical protein QGI86_25050 [Candidatus Poribacteria bacterium]|nr:hypothetical protein [Candidatus Poribacteria bacterium]
MGIEDYSRHYNQDLIEDRAVEMVNEFLRQEGYIEGQLHQQWELVEKQRQASKAEKMEIESGIEASLNSIESSQIDLKTFFLPLNHTI